MRNRFKWTSNSRNTHGSQPASPSRTFHWLQAKPLWSPIPTGSEIYMRLLRLILSSSHIVHTVSNLLFTFPCLWLATAECTTQTQRFSHTLWFPLSSAEWWWWWWWWKVFPEFLLCAKLVSACSTLYVVITGQCFTSDAHAEFCIFSLSVLKIDLYFHFLNEQTSLWSNTFNTFIAFVHIGDKLFGNIHKMPQNQVDIQPTSHK